MRCLPLLTFALLFAGCNASPTPIATVENAGVPLVRVRLLSGVSAVKLAAARPPLLSTTDHPAPRSVVLSGDAATLTRAGGQWRLNGRPVGTGAMTLAPASPGDLTVGGKPYRGFYVFQPTDGETFDVVNHVGLEDYLAGVVPMEMPADWNPQAYRAQAVAARTYALYDIQSRPPSARTWDVYDDTRSQVYGGLGAESDKSRAAVADTAGVVLAYGPAGREKIFKAYFSSCCGGVTAAADEVFDETPIPPLSAQATGDLCAASPVHDWPTVTIPKAELTRRLRASGKGMGKMAAVDHIDVARRDLGRPVNFVVVDAAGETYPLKSDAFRTAVNASADGGPTLRSGFCTPVASADAIAFTDGHGWGHGVGLCQWGAQARAEQGAPWDQILAKAYPQSTLVRAY